MRKKILGFSAVLFALFLLSGCAGAPAENEPPINAFELSEKCPKVCWMGIQPGVTTQSETLRILESSGQIDQRSVEKRESRLLFPWFVDKNKNLYYTVGIDIENDVVSWLSFLLFKNISLRDFILAFGEPDEISIARKDAPDDIYLYYILYYSEKQIMIEVLTWDFSGPQANDFPRFLGINLEFDGDKLPKWKGEKYAERKPWLGYGHIEEYLPGVTLPESP
jgi:hypothetical protein